MILPSRRAKFWVGVAGLAVLIVSYIRYTRTVPLVHDGTPMGFFYGMLAVILVVVLLAFGVRKRSYRSTWGPSTVGSKPTSTSDCCRPW